MNILNFEFKARVSNLHELENKFLTLQPIFHGEDRQVDTYFNVKEGRLKLREGNIENALIYYERQNTSSAKQSNVILYKHQPGSSLKQILEKVNGIKVIVDKRRRIYFIGNVKFHFDMVNGLGTFVEVEAKDETGKTGIEKLEQQCLHYFQFFNLRDEDYVHCSYSDLIMDLKCK